MQPHDRHVRSVGKRGRRNGNDASFPDATTNAGDGAAAPGEDAGNADATLPPTMTDDAAIDSPTSIDTTDAMDAMVAVDANSTLPPYVQAVLASGPIAYWRFEETLGSTASSIVNDATGKLDGIYELNTTQGVPGALGPNGGVGFRALASGTPSNYGIRMRDILPLVGNAAYTVEFWVRPTTGPDMYYREFFGRYIGGTVEYFFSYTDQVTNYLHFEQLYSDCANSCSNYGYGNPSRMPTLGAWTHMAVVFDGSTLILYENAKNSYSMPWSTGGSAADGGAGIFSIASDYDGDNSLGGDFDEFAVYAKALDSATILDHWELGANAQDAGADQ